MEITEELRTIWCCKCHIPFATTLKVYEHLKKTSDTFYCPMGHPQYYRESEVEKLQERLRQAEKTREAAERSIDYWRSEAQTSERRRIGTRAALTRLKNRIANQNGRAG